MYDRQTMSDVPTVTNFVESHNSINTSEIMNAPEHRSYGNRSFEELSALKDLKSNVNLVSGNQTKDVQLL